MYNCNIAIRLRPTASPYIKLMLDDTIIYTGNLDKETTFTIDRDLSIDQHTISLELTKTDNEQLVDIDGVVFEGIEADRFAWVGEYTPAYPEPWASQQTAAGKELAPVITGCRCLGWNGQWTLKFSVPIFTWIHDIENLGWRYD